MGLWPWVGEASASRTRATEVAPTLAGKVECSFFYTKLDNIFVPVLTEKIISPRGQAAQPAVSYGAPFPFPKSHKYAEICPKMVLRQSFQFIIFLSFNRLQLLFFGMTIAYI